MLFIRTDANRHIGMGHAMRCLTIAKAAKRIGIPTVFLTADEKAAAFFLEQEQECVVLHTDYRYMESETVAEGVLWEVLTKDKSVSPRLLIDSYQVTPEYTRKIKSSFPHMQLVLMEDFGKTDCTADTIINYNIYGEDCAGHYKGVCRHMLLGCSYMPLREEFARQPYKTGKKVKNVLLTTGGGDSLHIAPTLVKELAVKKEFCFHVVCGMFSDSLPTLEKLAAENKNIKVYTEVKAMWELMAKCDAAISAAGTTLYELCAAGVPAVCFSFASNQILPAQSFAKYTPMLYAGDFREGKEYFVRRVETCLKELAQKPSEQRKEISRECKRLVDGKGAERIITELFKDR